MLLTSPPLTAYLASKVLSSFDLHVLCAPPAFILSQDQTLIFKTNDKRRSAVSDFSKTSSTYTSIVSSVFVHLPCITCFSFVFSFACFYNILSLEFSNSFFFIIIIFYFMHIFIYISAWFLKGFFVYFSMYFFAPYF